MRKNHIMMTKIEARNFLTSQDNDFFSTNELEEISILIQQDSV